MVTQIARINANRQLAQGVNFRPPAGMRFAAPVAPLPRRPPTGGDLADQLGAASATILTHPAFQQQQQGGGLKDTAIHGLGWVIGNPVSQAVLKPLSVLDYPRAAVVGTLRQVLETEALEQANRALAKLPGIDYTPIARPEGNEAGFQWGEMWRDTKKHEGFGTSIIEPQFEDSNIWLRRVLGFAGDIASDPLMKLGTGTHAASGTEARINYLNKLLDAQQAAGLESKAATEAAEFAAEHALLGGTGAEAAQATTRAAAERYAQRLEDLTQIGDRNAIDVIRRRGVNVASPEQLAAMGAPQHAIRFAGEPIENLVRRFMGETAGRGTQRVSEATSRAMSRFLGGPKELWTQTVGAGGRKLITPMGKIRNALGPATERILTDKGAMPLEVALRTHAINQVMRKGAGDFRAPAVEYLHRLVDDLKGFSKDQRADLVREAEETGVENAVTKMGPQMLETIKEAYRQAGIPEHMLDDMVPELKPWRLPNGEMSRYTMPHVLSRDSWRFFNRLRKGQNPMLDFIRRDLGIHDKDLLEEGGFLQRRLFRPNADGSPQTFKIGEDEVTIHTGSVAELEDKLGGLLRKHGFEGKMYETDPVEAWRRYIQSTEKDVARRIAEHHGTRYGFPGWKYKGDLPPAWDPLGRELKMQPAPGETEPRYVRGEVSKTTRPIDTDVYKMVEDEEATKARNKIILEGGEKGPTAQVLGEFRETATAERENLAQRIENTRQYVTAAFEQAKGKSSRALSKAEALVERTYARVDKLYKEYIELLKESSANEELIRAGEGTIHGIRSQTPKNIRAAQQQRLAEIAGSLAKERERLQTMQDWLEHVLTTSEQGEIAGRLNKVYDLAEGVRTAEQHLDDVREKATNAVRRRLERDVRAGHDIHMIDEVEMLQAEEVLRGGADSEAANRARELLERRDRFEANKLVNRQDALRLQEQADRLQDRVDQLGAGGRSAEQRQRLAASRSQMEKDIATLRRQARQAQDRADLAQRGLLDVEPRIRDDEWMRAQRTVEQYNEQQAMIENFDNGRDIDMLAAKSQLNAAQRDWHDYVVGELETAKQTKAAAAEAARAAEMANVKPVESLYEILGPETKVRYHLSKPPDDLPGAEDIPGYHVIEVSRGEDAIASIQWNAETGNVLPITVEPSYQRQGIGTSLYDQATQYSEAAGLVKPQHVPDEQTAAGRAWAPEADKRIAARPESMRVKGAESPVAQQARAALDTPAARGYIADDRIAEGLREQIDAIENPAQAPRQPAEWNEVGRKPAKESRQQTRWRAYNSRRRKLLGEMERIREEEHLTAPPTGFETESYKHTKQRPNEKLPKFMEEYREKPRRRRIRGREPWWTEEYSQRPDLTSSKRSRNARLKKLQEELDTVEDWLAKHPQPAVQKFSPRALKLRTRINGKLVKLDRVSGIGVMGGAEWKVTLPGGAEHTFNGTMIDAMRQVEDFMAGATKEAVAPPEPGMVRLYRGDPTVPPMSAEAAREARAARGLGWIDESEEVQARAAVQGRWFTTDPDLATSYPTNRDPFEGNKLSYVDIPQEEYEQLRGLAGQPEAVRGLSRDPTEVILPEQYMRQVREHPPVTTDLRRRLTAIEERLAANPQLAEQVARDRQVLTHEIEATRQPSARPFETEFPPLRQPTREELLRQKYEPRIEEAKQRVQRFGAIHAGEELEGIRRTQQIAANERIAGLQAENESLRFQNQRIGEMITDLYDNRMPDPVRDWRAAEANADAARATHEQIKDYVERNAVRQRALDIVENNARKGAPTAEDLKRVRAYELRPADAQGLRAAVRDIENFMAGAEGILPVSVRKRIEAALMAHEQALHALTTTNDLPASALAKVQRAAMNGKVAPVLKAQLRDAWREVGDGSVIIDKDLQRMMFGVEQALDSKLFGRLFTTWTNFFKTYATLTPGFHVRNALSAIFMNATEGVTFGEQIRAMQLWKKYRASTDPLEFLRGLSKEERAAFTATFASGAGGQFVEGGLGEARAGAGRAAERAFANPATRLSKRMGEWVEGPQRLALGLHTTARGGSVDEALARITRIHFDYGQVSKFDETMKRVVPFWTFMSRNVPLQFTQMWMRPRAYLKFQSALRNLQLGNEDQPIIPSYITQAGGTYFGVKTPGWASKIPIVGPPAGMPIVAQPDLPHTRYADDLQRLQNALSGQGLGQMATNLNPLLTVPAEYVSRTDFFTGQQFDKTDRVKVGGLTLPYAVALSLLGQAQRGPDGNWYMDAAALNALRGLDPNLDRLMRLAPQAAGLEGTDRTGASTTARQAESWARWAGFPVRTISEQQQRSALRAQAFQERDRRALQAAMGG